MVEHLPFKSFTLFAIRMSSHLSNLTLTLMILAWDGLSAVCWEDALLVL